MPSTIADEQAAELTAQLISGLAELGQPVSDKQTQQLIQYLLLLQRWNSRYNLTAIKSPQQMLIRHVLDSLAVVRHIKGHSFLDVGTGAGLPGIPLAIMNPSHRVDLLDSNGKKTRFLFQVKLELGLTNTSVIKTRVESHQDETGYEGILSRAFSSLSEMLDTTQHLLAPKGKFYAMKGKILDTELSQLPKNYNVEALVPLVVPGLSEERHLVIIERT